MDDDLYDVDIYGEMLQVDLEKECEKLKAEISELQNKTEEFLVKIDKLSKEKEKLVRQNRILEKNISCLLKTAKKEISRKDSSIVELRNQLAEVHARLSDCVVGGNSWVRNVAAAPASYSSLQEATLKKPKTEAPKGERIAKSNAGKQNISKSKHHPEFQELFCEEKEPKTATNVNLSTKPDLRERLVELSSRTLSRGDMEGRHDRDGRMGRLDHERRSGPDNEKYRSGRQRDVEGRFDDGPNRNRRGKPYERDRYRGRVRPRSPINSRSRSPYVSGGNHSRSRSRSPFTSRQRRRSRSRSPLRHINSRRSPHRDSRSNSPPMPPSKRPRSPFPLSKRPRSPVRSAHRWRSPNHDSRSNSPQMPLSERSQSPIPLSKRSHSPIPLSRSPAQLTHRRRSPNHSSRSNSPQMPLSTRSPSPIPLSKSQPPKPSSNLTRSPIQSVHRRRSPKQDSSSNIQPHRALSPFSKEVGDADVLSRNKTFSKLECTVAKVPCEATGSVLGEGSHAGSDHSAVDARSEDYLSLSDHLTTKEERIKLDDGETSDTDYYDDAIEEPTNSDWQLSFRNHRPKEPAIKTLFTMRMEQKLKREAEEERAKAEEAAAEEKTTTVVLMESDLQSQAAPDQTQKAKKGKHLAPLEILPRKNDLELVKDIRSVKKVDETASTVHQSCILPDTDAIKVKISNNCRDTETRHVLWEGDKEKQEYSCDKMDTSVEEGEWTEENKEENMTVVDSMPECSGVQKSALASVAAKIMSVMTFSPFKNNYKLIELSPLPDSKKVSLLRYHLNVKTGKTEEPQMNEADVVKGGAEDATNVEDTAVAAVVEQFSVAKPLKPLTVADILSVGCTSNAPIVEKLAEPGEDSKSARVAVAAPVVIEGGQSVLNSISPPEPRNHFLDKYVIPKNKSKSKHVVTSQSVLEFDQELSAKPVKELSQKRKFGQKSDGKQNGHRESSRKSSKDRLEDPKDFNPVKKSRLISPKTNNVSSTNSKRIPKKSLVAGSNQKEKENGVNKKLDEGEEGTKKMKKCVATEAAESKKDRDAGISTKRPLKGEKSNAEVKMTGKKHKDLIISPPVPKMSKEVARKRDDTKKSIRVVEKESSSTENPSKPLLKAKETYHDVRKNEKNPKDLKIEEKLSLPPSERSEEKRESRLLGEEERKEDRVQLLVPEVDTARERCLKANDIPSAEPPEDEPRPEKQPWKPEGSYDNCDIANFEIFKSVNLSSSSSSFEKSHESRRSSRLRNDLQLTDSGGEEEDEEEEEAEDLVITEESSNSDSNSAASDEIDKWF